MSLPLTLPPSPSSPPTVAKFQNETENSDYDLTRPIPPTAPGLRSSLTSYGDPHFSLFLRKAFISASGYTPTSLSAPIIGIINTSSSFNPCHGNTPQLLDALKRGILLSGGLPMDFPTISIHESFASPTSMLLRNLMAMDTEEMILAQPIDAIVTIGGCDKTVPAQLMGCISANIPTFPLVTGPMMPGSYRGTRVGACTDCRSHWAKYRADEIDEQEIEEVNAELCPTVGTCGVMGTASTMACLLAAMGLVPLRGGASAPAVSAARLRVGEITGRAAVDAVKSEKGEMKVQEVLSRENFLNAITVLQAIGGSTNAVVHLLAIINRHPGLAGSVNLETVDKIGRSVPLLVDLKPSGENYMNDFHNAGGMLALMHRLRPLLRLEARTYTGQTLGGMLDSNPFTPFPLSTQIIRGLEDPIHPNESLVVLMGNLARDGCVMKASASKEKRLLQHRGRACVFVGTEDMARRIDGEELEVDEDTVLVLQGIGPVGNPGMPEAGLIPIPRKLARQGVKDMLRVSDGRMSGTAAGSIVLHISPESVLEGSIFGVVKDGDWISCDVEGRKLELEVKDEELRRRLDERKRDMEKKRKAEAESGKVRRGYRELYVREVNQAHEGCDFEFLTAQGKSSWQ